MKSGAAQSWTVLNVAYPLAPVGPDTVGGAEQVLTLLDSALVQAGHRSIVIACEGSRVQGTLLATPRRAGMLDPETRAAAVKSHRLAIAQALAQWRIDVVHVHGVDFHEYLPPPGVSVLATLHLPTHWYPPKVFLLTRPNTFLHCVSISQAKLCPQCRYLLPAIGNGVPNELFTAQHAKRRFALVLGRICPEKGFHLALDAAALARFPLLLAGEVFSYPEHRRYFESEIAPRLNGLLRFIGPVGFRRKRRLLAAASCLLVPSLVPETSSLVAMEALAGGTPVIAFPVGALTEIVEHGKTGFLVNNEREMAKAMLECSSLSPDGCRQQARERFSLCQMVEKYFAVYRLLADSELKRD